MSWFENTHVEEAPASAALTAISEQAATVAQVRGIEEVSVEYVE